VNFDGGSAKERKEKGLNILEKRQNFRAGRKGPDTGRGAIWASL